MFIGSNDQTGTTKVGKVWVEYDIELFVPQLSPGESLGPSRTAYYANTTQTVTTAVEANLNFTTATFDSLGFGAGTAGSFTPPAGTYQVQVQTTCFNSVLEVTQFILLLRKNSGALAPTVRSQVHFDAGSTPSNLPVAPLSLSGIVTCNGTDTFDVRAVVTAATGTLTLQNSIMTIRPV
jgi:hypothetical protein